MIISNSVYSPGLAKCSPLIILASSPGYTFWDYFHILEKAIILIRWGVDVSCTDVNGNTVLHRILCCRRSYYDHHGLRPFLEPGELLKVFIAAGADIYALNNTGRSASRIARNFGREKEWIEALQFCGFDPQEIMTQTVTKYTPYMGPRQTSRLTFDEYCKTWDEKQWAQKMSWKDEADESDIYEDETYTPAPGLKQYYWEKKQRWSRRYQRLWKRDERNMRREARAKSKVRGESFYTVGEYCPCSDHDSANALESIEEIYEDESESEDLSDDSTECSSNFPFEARGYSSGDDSGDDFAGGHYYNWREEGISSESKDEIDHSITRDSAEHIIPASTAPEVTSDNSTNNDIEWQPMDPTLFTDETQSRASSWRYAAMEETRNEEVASMNGVDFFQDVEPPFDGAFQTEFDVFMADDLGTSQYQNSQL